MDGQQVFHVDGDRAKGTCYCFVIIVYTDADEMKVKSMSGTCCEDEYIKEKDRWELAMRKVFFTWRTMFLLGFRVSV